MLQKVIESLVQILNQDGYTNIVVSDTIKHANFTDYEKRLYTKLVYGVVENKILLDYLVQPLTSGKRIKPYLKNAIRVGVYSIDYLNIQDHYIVNSLVQTVKKKDYKASTFLNAILRKYLELPKRKIATGNYLQDLSIKYSINLELVELLQKQYPDCIEEILSVKQDSKQSYRINTLKTNKEEIANLLNSKGIGYQIIDDVILITKENLINDELFKNGLIVAQDASSIKVGLVLNPNINTSILDMCSAPGSKAMHLAAILNNTGKIIACDIYGHKVKLIEENAQKLGVTNVVAKLLDGKNSSFEKPFDYILMDVPCSGLGVLNHKPDIKYQMTIEKINGIKKDQEQIVENGLKYLKKGGIVLYSTCTINKDENELFIEKLLRKHPNFKILEELKYLPTSTNDGFYICKLKETTNEE